MMKPSSKGRGATSKGIADDALGQNTNKNRHGTPSKQLSARRKTSAEIASAVNGFIEDARSAQCAAVKAETADPKRMKPKVTESNRTGISRNEMIQRLMQGQKLPMKTGKVLDGMSIGKSASSTATISFGKNVLKVEPEKPLSKSRAVPRTTPELPQTSTKQPDRKPGIRPVGVETRKTASAISARAATPRRSGGSGAVLRDDEIGDGNHGLMAKTKSTVQKSGGENPAPKYSPNYYLTSSSSEDEEMGRPTRDKGYEKPASPASKAKMWNEIHKTPGPSFPGWKFRPPAHGRRLSQVGAEELAETFKNIDIEAERAPAKVQAGESRQTKFSDYMRKIKPTSKSKDADTSSARLEENLNLKKIYSDQLDAMREKALATIKALDAETRGSDGDVSLEVVKDGVSRTYRGMSSTDMLKNAVESLQQHRKESFNVQKSEDGTYLDRQAGYAFAQGDRLNRKELEKNGKVDLKNSSAASGSGSPGVRVRVTKDEQVRTKKKEAHGLLEAQTQDAERMKAFKDTPLQKLKKISETLKVERANAMSRRALPSMNYSSSDSGSSR